MDPAKLKKRQKKMSFHTEWYFKVKTKVSINKIIPTVAFYEDFAWHS